MENNIHIIICAKQVFDPDAPPSAFRVDADNRKVVPEAVPPVVNPFDQNALEAALRIKDQHGGKITIVSMGREPSKRVLNQIVATGADDLVLLQDALFEDLDSYGAASVLAAGIREIGGYDLILCGGQAADSNSGQVGIGIAELLGIPCISLVKDFKLHEGKLELQSSIPDGYQESEVSMPLLATVNSELFELRYPKLTALRTVAKKAPLIMNAADLQVDPEILRRTELVTLSARVSNTTCKYIEGETPEETGVNLALKLIESKVI